MRKLKTASGNLLRIPKSNAADRGFSLLEIIISTVILMIIGLSVVSFVKNNAFSVKRSHSLASADQLAAATLENYKRTFLIADSLHYYDSILTVSDGKSATRILDPDTTDGLIYVREIRMTKNAYGSIQLRSNVRWIEGVKDTHTVSVGVIVSTQ